jgi:hypothetical protein
LLLLLLFDVLVSVVFSTVLFLSFLFTNTEQSCCISEVFRSAIAVHLIELLVPTLNWRHMRRFLMI